MKVLDVWTQRARVVKRRLPALSAPSLDFISAGQVKKKSHRAWSAARGPPASALKLMRQRQIKTVFRINSCPWASSS